MPVLGAPDGSRSASANSMRAFTKRCFGFDRCAWRGYQSFQAYAWASVLCTNLLLMARRTMT
jgi:hypothetical protein